MTENAIPPSGSTGTSTPESADLRREIKGQAFSGQGGASPAKDPDGFDQPAKPSTGEPDLFSALDDYANNRMLYVRRAITAFIDAAQDMIHSPPLEWEKPLKKMGTATVDFGMLCMAKHFKDFKYIEEAGLCISGAVVIAGNLTVKSIKGKIAKTQAEARKKAEEDEARKVRESGGGPRGDGGGKDPSVPSNPVGARGKRTGRPRK